MRSLISLVLALSATTVSAAPVTDSFECRFRTPPVAVTPPLKVIRLLDDRRQATQERWFDAEGQKLFGLPALFLSYVVNASGGGESDNHGPSNIVEHYYTAIVKGKVDEVRWLVEKANPDIRCVPNGTSQTCLVASQIGTSGGEIETRTMSLYPASGKDEEDGVEEGTVVTCSFNTSK